MTTLYPLRFKEILRNYAFGGRWIVSEFAKEGLPEDHRIAETWEVCDRPGESSEVVNGPLRGQSLHELIDAYGESFLGSDVVARCGTRFPLLIKFLDASNPLGEQVHESDEIAARRGLSDPGKTEAWYMLRVKPEATIRCGETPEATPERVEAALRDGSIRELMAEYAVQPGDAFLLYAGAMHYSAGGVIFYEIMQNSDVVIGLRGPYPGRGPTDMDEYVEQSMEAIHLEPGCDYKATPVSVAEGQNSRTWLFACNEFCLERMDVAEDYVIDCDGERFYVLSLIEGAADVVSGDYSVRLRPGYTCLLPASLGQVEVRPVGNAALLKAYVPDLLANVVAPLRAAGVSDESILGLGGKTALSPLAKLL